MTRLLLVILVSLGALVAAARPSPAAGPRPNFILIYTDDQRWDALSVVQKEQGARARFPWLKTPNLDRLAAEGTRFRNAFVVNALCAPSRASFLTGQYGHTNGVVNNHTPFPDANVTFATQLRGAGYRTGYVGKWHHGAQSGQRPGFDYSASFVGQGVYFDCPVEVNGLRTPTTGWVDDVSTDYALGFLRENKERPFALVLGFKTCHGPFQPAERHQATYEGESARSVPNLTVPAIYGANGRAARAAPPAEGPIRTNLGYFRGIAGVDENVGKLLKALDDLKLAENTMVVFASDNGYYLGEHMLGDKRSAYEESMRIPLLVRYPKLAKPPRTSDRIALNVDVAPTFLDYAGVPVPKQVHGRSLRPLLEEKPAADWRKSFFYCYFFERGFRIPTVTAVRTDTAKLIRYPGHDDWTELFDLTKDPYEIKNLAADPSADGLKKELEAEYARQSAAISFTIPPFADNPAADQAKPPLKAWVLEYRFAQDTPEQVHDSSGKGNHGKPVNAPLVDGRDGGKARSFDGTSHIDVGKSASLDPAVAGWTVDVVLRAQQPDGVLLACGGQTNGYSLTLEDGKPVFTVVSASSASRVVAPKGVGDGWVRVTATITAAKQLRLTVDGKPAGQARLHDFISRQPNDTLQIGADTGSQVDVKRVVPRFKGVIESVRIYSGEAP